MITRDELQIFDVTPAVILAAVRADYTALTGRTLQPAQAETLLLNVFAYREYLLREQMNEAIRNSLVPFASAPMLDYLAEFVGVTRLPASGALCTLSFSTGGNNPGPVVVPAGTRVTDENGQFVFETTADLTIPAGYAGPVLLSVEAICTTDGEAGNGQRPTVILDPVAYVLSVTASEPTGGSDGETDEQLRARIRLAPNAFSAAGPVKAYAYFATQAHPDVIDVAVTNPKPGIVRLYPLVSGGAPSAEILAVVLAACSAEDVRPLCDTVQVAAPTVTEYTVSVELELLNGAPATATKASVEAALLAYVNERAAGLGRDVVRERVSALAMLPNVYRVRVVAPAETLIVDASEVAICTGLKVAVTGFNNG